MADDNNNNSVADGQDGGGSADNNPGGIVNADGSFSEDWRNRFADNEEIAQSKVLDNVKNFDDLVGQFVNGQKVIGQKTEGMVKIPGEDASEEDVKAFREAMGVPEKPNDYEIGRPEDIPEDRYDVEMEKKFRGIFHELNLPKQTAETLHGRYNELQKARMEAMEQAEQKQIEDTEKALKKEWGGDHAANMETAKRAYAKLGLEELAQITGMGDDARFLKAVFDLGQKISEDGHIKGDGGGKEKTDDGEITFNYDNS